MADKLSRLADFILDCWDQAVQMRASGVAVEDIQTGLKKTVIDGARTRGFVTEERDLPRWLFKRCAVCEDTGWERCTRLVRGEVVEAYRRCVCKEQVINQQQDDHAVASKVASGWKQAGRR